MRFISFSNAAGVIIILGLIVGYKGFSPYTAAILYDANALLSHSIFLFNVEIPTIIFLLTIILIFIPFLYFSLKFTIWEVPLVLSRFNELGRVFEELRLQEPNGHLTGAGLDELRHSTETDQNFADAWKSFDRTLIHEGSEKVHIWASQPLSEAFNLRSLVYQINLELYRVLPGIFTGLGLLLTFLAILIALSGVKVLQDQSVSGIDLLVSGLSGKFFSSVVALLLATAFLMEEKRQERRLNLGLTGMLQKLDNLLPRKNPEMLLFDIRKENMEQSRAMRTLVTDMADKLPASFQESLSPIMLAMSDAIERLKNEQLAALNNFEQVIPPKIKEVLSDLFSARLDTMTAALERYQQQTIQGTQETFGELVEIFKQTLTGTTDTQFARLAEVLNTTSAVLHDLVDKFQQTQQVLDEQIGRVLQSVQSQTMTLTQGVVDKFMETVEHLKSLTQTSSQTLYATADQAVAHVAEQGKQYLVSLERVSKSLEDQVNRMMDVMHKQTGMVTDETSRALQEAVTQIRTISEASVQHVSQASESALGQLTQRGGEYFDQVRGTLEHLVRRAAELAEALNRTSENILIGADGVETTIKQYETAIQSGTNLVQALQGISASMAAVTRDSRMVTDNWSAVVAAQQDVTGRLNRAVEEMGKISRDSHGLMETAPKVFSGIHQEYRQIVEVVHSNIRDYTDTVKQGLENFLQQANTYFNDTVQSLGSAVGELSETLQDLTDELQKALSILRKEGKP